MPHLLDLPDEVILNIIATCAEDRDARHRLSFQSPGRQTILNLAQSCRHVFSLAEPWLYNTITLRKGIANSAPFKHFKLRLLAEPRRDNYVKDIALVPARGEVDPDLLSWGSFVAGLPNVEHLFVEVPFNQSDAIHDEETGDYVSPFWTTFKKTFSAQHVGSIPQMKVPAWANSLTTCHLNFNAPSGFCAPLDDIANVIAAPQLRHLSFVAADLSEFGLDHRTTRMRSSPLQHLRLENCIVSDSAMRHMLSIPRGLVSFFEHGGLSPNDNSTAPERLHSLVQALAQHRSTLTTLDINPREIRALPDFETNASQTITLALFTSLTHLTIDLRDWRFEPGPTPFLERLPSQLKHLHVKVDLTYYSAPIPAYFAYWANRIRRRTNRYRTANSTFPQLQSFAAEMMHIAPNTINASQRDDLETAAWRLKRESKVRMLIYRRTKQRLAMPPYLWDEYEPELVTMLDSDVMESKCLWDTQTPSEIELLKRLEEQWDINRMIELDQERLEQRRQRIIGQIEKWEQEEMPCEADLEEAVLASKKDKSRKMREAMDEWKGFPLVPPENGDGWEWETDLATAVGTSKGLDEAAVTNGVGTSNSSHEDGPVNQVAEIVEPTSTSEETTDHSKATTDSEPAKAHPTQLEQNNHTNDSILSAEAAQNESSASTEEATNSQTSLAETVSVAEDCTTAPTSNTNQANAEKGSSNLVTEEGPTETVPNNLESTITEINGAPQGQNKGTEADPEQKQRDNKDAKATAKGKEAAAAATVAADAASEEGDATVPATNPAPSPSQSQPLSAPVLNSTEPVAVS